LKEIVEELIHRHFEAGTANSFVIQGIQLPPETPLVAANVFVHHDSFLYIILNSNQSK
jgi:hypothetical protein